MDTDDDYAIKVLPKEEIQREKKVYFNMLLCFDANHILKTKYRNFLKFDYKNEFKY